MTTRMKLMMIPGILCVLLVGCATLDKQVEDPNSALNTIPPVAQALAPAAGPYGWIVGGLATLVTAATGVYKVRQKNDRIDIDTKLMTRQQREYNAIRATTSAIVEAIEQLGAIKIPSTTAVSKDGTLSGAVKMQVQNVLEKNKIDVIGKAIIDGLKASQKKQS